jgi:density-regulated protein DRP1
VGEIFDELNGGEAGAEGAKSRRGGAGVPNKGRKKGAKGEQMVVIERAQRQKRKFVTSVVGLDTFDVKLKDAAKRLGKKFACGASIDKLPDGRESIDIQGDYIYEMPDTVLEFFPEVAKSKVFLLEDGKKVKAFP